MPRSKRQRSNNNNGNLRKRNNNKNKKNVKKAKVQFSRTILPTPAVRLSGCAKDYISCLTNPFRNISPLPCIPDLIALPSNKFQVRVMSATITNASGIGQVGLYPYNSIVSDRRCLYTNNNLFNPGANDFIFSATNVNVNTAFSNSPYTVATFADNYVQARLVGMGVKVRYAGTELNRAGTITLYKSQSNIPFNQGTAAQLLRDPFARRVSMERKFYSVCYTPDDPDFLGYQSLKELSAGAPDPLDPGATLMLIIKGAQANQEFEVECVGYWEMIGSLVGSSNTTFTKSHSDINGLSAALGSLPSKISKKSAEALESTVLQKAGQYLLHGTSYVVGAALPALAGAAAKAVFMPQQQQQVPLLLDEVD